MMNYSSNEKIRRVASNLLLVDGEFRRNPIIEFAADGEILSVEFREDVDRSAGTEFYSGIMMGGFVNAHSHLELAYLRGAIEAGTGFADFASSIGRVRNSFSEEERDRAVVAADLELKRGGVVAVGDIVNGVTSFAVKERSSIEYRNFAEVFGLNAIDSSAVDELLNYPSTSLTPHSTYSLNDKLFREIASTGGTPLSIHFMESPAERELYEGHGALHDWYSRVGFECNFLHYDSPAKRIVGSIPKDRSVILVHNCCITQEDIDIIMSHFTAQIYWAVCPRSNRYISNLRPPLDLLRKNGLNICVGTDSLASNWSLSMLDELREMEGTPLVERLDWATRIGARALQMPHVGTIEVGHKAHINILSGVDYQSMELTEKSKITRII